MHMPILPSLAPARYERSLATARNVTGFPTKSLFVTSILNFRERGGVHRFSVTGIPGQFMPVCFSAALLRLLQSPGGADHPGGAEAAQQEWAGRGGGAGAAL